MTEYKAPFGLRFFFVFLEGFLINICCGFYAILTPHLMLEGLVPGIVASFPQPMFASDAAIINNPISKWIHEISLARSYMHQKPNNELGIGFNPDLTSAALYGIQMFGMMLVTLGLVQIRILAPKVHHSARQTRAVLFLLFLGDLIHFYVSNAFNVAYGRQWEFQSVVANAVTVALVASRLFYVWSITRFISKSSSDNKNKNKAPHASHSLPAPPTRTPAATKKTK